MIRQAFYSRSPNHRPDAPYESAISRPLARPSPGRMRNHSRKQRERGFAGFPRGWPDLPSGGLAEAGPTISQVRGGEDSHLPACFFAKERSVSRGREKDQSRGLAKLVIRELQPRPGFR